MAANIYSGLLKVLRSPSDITDRVLLHNRTRISVPSGRIGFMSYSGTCSSNSKIEVAAVPSFVGNDLTHKAIKLSGEAYVKKLLETYNNQITAAYLIGIIVLPLIFSKLIEYSPQYASNFSFSSSLWGSLFDEKCFWTALEPPLRYLVIYLIFLLCVFLFTPSLLQYIVPFWKGFVIISFFWFLHQWKNNAINDALTMKTMQGANRNKLLTLNEVSSAGLFVTSLMALSGAYGFSVQSILTIGGIGGATIAFVARDVLGNIINGLSLRISKPFSIGDMIRAGSVEGTVEKMGLMSTTLLTTEKLRIIVPNSLFSSQVIANESCAQSRAMVTKIPLEVDSFDKIPIISKDIETMLNSSKNVYLKEQAPYCFLSKIEQSYAELTLGCNLKITTNDQPFSAQQDILLQCVRIIMQHGGTLGRFV